MRIWVAGVPGGWSGDRMRAALSAMKIETQLVNLSECSLDVRTATVRHGTEELSQLDGLVVRKLGDPTDPLTPYRVNLLRALEARGVRVFSPSRAIQEANDRYRMTLRLAIAGIPIPDTVVTESIDEAAELVERWGSAVVKPLFTSKGRGMVLLRGDRAARLGLKHWDMREHAPFYMQRYVQASYDIGVALLRNQVVGAFRRVAGGESWQTTIRSGGRYEPFQPDSRTSELAVAAAEQFGLDYTVVDMVQHKDDWLVYEVSAFGGFSGLWAGGVDAASKYANYVVAHMGLSARADHARTR